MRSQRTIGRRGTVRPSVCGLALLVMACATGCSEEAAAPNVHATELRDPAKRSADPRSGELDTELGGSTSTDDRAPARRAPANPGADERGTVDGVAPSSGQAQLELLEELGYADFTSTGADDEYAREGDGLLASDPDAASPGLTLVTSIGLGRADLLALDGSILGSWVDPDGRRWTRCELLRDGSLLALRVLGPADEAELEGVRGNEALWTGVDILCLGPNGGRRWTWEGSVHHDIEPLSGRRVAVLTRGQRRHAEKLWVDDRVTVLRFDKDGVHEDRVVERSILGPFLKWTDDEVLERRYPRILATADGADNARRPIDILHVNSLDQMSFDDLAGTSPAHTPDATLVSLRNQDRVVAVDLVRGEVLWTFGDGELRRQHEATYLPNGNILVFDNGDEDRPWSRVVEISPRTDAIVWEYVADPPEAFYTRRRGTSQSLPNGNVLIASSQQASVFEVTRSGRVVWDWINPNRNEDGQRSAVRAERYPPNHLRNRAAFVGSQPEAEAGR